MAESTKRTELHAVVTQRKPRRLTQDERDRHCNALEAAINGGWDELRVYWIDGEVHSRPLRLGKVA